MNPLKTKLEAFTRLSQADRAAIDRATARNVREVAARRDFVREGDVPRAVYVVCEGWACRHKMLPDGRRQIVAFFVPGDLCDLNVFILREMDHAVGAITSLKVAEIGREDFQRLTDEHPRITQALWWNALVDSAIEREWLLSVGQRTAYERLAHLMCELFVRLRTVGRANGTSCEFPITQADIGEATGLTSVHVNRTLQELRREGLIELHGRRLNIPDFDRLREAAMFNDNYLHLDREGRHLDAND